MKGLKRPTFSEDDILVLPRALSELSDRNRVSLRTGSFERTIYAVEEPSNAGGSAGSEERDEMIWRRSPGGAVAFQTLETGP